MLIKKIIILLILSIGFSASVASKESYMCIVKNITIFQDDIDSPSSKIALVAEVDRNKIYTMYKEPSNGVINKENFIIIDKSSYGLITAFSEIAAGFKGVSFNPEAGVFGMVRLVLGEIQAFSGMCEPM